MCIVQLLLYRLRAGTGVREGVVVVMYGEGAVVSVVSTLSG